MRSRRVLGRAEALGATLLVLVLAGPAVAQRPERAREAPAAPAADPVDAMRAVFRKLADEMSKHPRLKGKTVGVMPFPMAKGAVTEVGLYLSDMLEVELITVTNGPDGAASRPLAIVTRKDLCEVIRENKLWLADRFDPKLHEKLGGLSEADFLATGRVVERGRSLAVTLRLVETEKGRLVWGRQVHVPVDDGLRKLVDRQVGTGGCEGDDAPATGGTSPTGASSAATAAAPTATPANPAGTPGRLEVRAWFDKPSYRVGDELRIGVRVNRDAYVTLVNVGTSGKVNVLFPNGFHPDNFVRANQDVFVPPSNAFALTVDGPTGFDQVIAIATEERVAFVDTDFTNVPGTFRPLERMQTRSIVVGTKELKKRLPPDKVAEHVIAVEIGPAAPRRSDEHMQPP